MMKTQQKLAYLSLSLIMLFATVSASPVAALTAAEKNELTNQKNELQTKISALDAKIDDFSKRASALAQEGDSVENEIAAIKNEQAILSAQIELTQAEYEQILVNIESIENRIEKNSHTISLIISQYYYSSNTTTLERIASSDSFASYLDDEMRLGNLADTVVEMLQENKRLKAELDEQKLRAENLLKSLEEQKSNLEQKKKEQAIILETIRSSEAEYNRMKDEVATERKNLDAQQREIQRKLDAANQASGLQPGDPNKGGYPYSAQCPAAKLEGWQYPDRWGMYICECVSYTAWKVEQRHGVSIRWGGRGNANQWVNSARRDGFRVSSQPKPGAVGISMAGPYGHAVWVESVSGNRVHVSQYNYSPGQYSEMDINASAYTYIYFDERV